jgi:hypothetical protein
LVTQAFPACDEAGPASPVPPKERRRAWSGFCRPKKSTQRKGANMAAKRTRVPPHVSDLEILDMPSPPEAKATQKVGSGNLRLTRRETELLIHALEHYLGGPPPEHERRGELDHLDRMSELAQRIRQHILKKAK